MKKIIWRKQGTYTDKRRARRIAKMLRAPGEDKVRSRVVREVYWRVDHEVKL